MIELPIEQCDKLHTYIGTDEGCCDLGAIELGDYTLVKRETLHALMTELHKLRHPPKE